MTRGPARFAPLAGIVFFVLAVVAFAVLGSDAPEADASAPVVAAFYARNTTQQALSAYALILAVPFLVIFASALRTRLAELRSPKVWRHLAFGGGVIAATGFLIASSIVVALSDGAQNHFPPLVMQGINAIGADTFPIFVAGLGIMLLGSAGGILGGAGLAKWLGWVALVIGIACFIPWVAFVGFLASAIWVVIASVVLYTTGTPGRESEAAPAAR